MTPEQFTLFADSLPEPLLLVDAHGHILAKNVAAIELLGSDPDRHNLFEISSDRHEKLRSFLKLCRKNRQIVFGGISLWNSQGESVRMRLGGCRPVMDSPNLLLRLDQQEIASRFLLLNEKIDHLSAEIHRRIQLASQLEQAHAKLETYTNTLQEMVDERTAELRRNNESLEAFCYSVAHDLRAPLRSITSFAEILEVELAQNEPGDTTLYIGKIRKAADRMHQLINDLLAYARISQSELHVTALDLTDQAQTTVKHLESEIRACAATVELQHPLPAVLANETAMEQVLSNLLLNALKFARPSAPPVVRLSAKPTGRHAVIYVQDNGIGVAPEHSERIFRVFERLNPTYPGTGIGLAIVKNAIERMGGSVGVTSNGETGSTFWFKLPLAGRPCSTSTSTPAPASTSLP